MVQKQIMSLSPLRSVYMKFQYVKCLTHLFNKIYILYSFHTYYGNISHLGVIYYELIRISPRKNNLHVVPFSLMPPLI